MTLFFQILNFVLTGFLTVYVMLGQKRQSRKKACVIGIGFFVVAVYVDCIFSMIMEGVAGAISRPLFQILGIVVSKSILLAALMMGRVLLTSSREVGKVEPEVLEIGNRKDIENRESKENNRKKIEPNKRENNRENYREKDRENKEGNEGLTYLDCLTVGVHLFFLILTPLMLGSASGRIGSLHRLFMLLFFLAVMLVYDTSLYIHGRKQQERTRQSEDAARRHEADLYLKGVEDNYQRTRELWHDLKNHINLLNLLLQEKKYEQLGDYLRIFGEDVDSLTLPEKSGNLVVDALLADKLGRAKKENIAVELSLCNLTGLRLRSDEICGLFGNLLDNALEASLQVAEGRFLEIDCRELEDCFYIRVRNAAAGSAREQGGVLQSGKWDKRNRVGHGLGLRSVERIVHGCGGEMAVDSKESCFTVVVRLPK